MKKKEKDKSDRDVARIGWTSKSRRMRRTRRMRTMWKCGKEKRVKIRRKRQSQVSFMFEKFA